MRCHGCGISDHTIKGCNVPAYFVIFDGRFLCRRCATAEAAKHGVQTRLVHRETVGTPQPWERTTQLCDGIEISTVGPPGDAPAYAVIVALFIGGGKVSFIASTREQLDTVIRNLQYAKSLVWQEN
jgi:hypothetical protein